MKITVLLHDDLNDEQSDLVSRFAEAIMRAGGSITLRGCDLGDDADDTSMTDASLPPPALSVPTK
jgi:hypothetical protein